MVVEPGHQRKVVRQAPKAGHRKVGVDIDQAGHHDAAGGIDPLMGNPFKSLSDRSFGDEIDLAVPYPDNRIFHDLGGRRHRQQRSSDNQDILCFLWDVHKNISHRTSFFTQIKENIHEKVDLTGNNWQGFG